MVEAMNHANKRMRIGSSVDLVNATILLLKMEAERYEKQKDYAVNCNSVLTPKGSALRTEVLEMVKKTDESFRVIATKIEQDEDHPHPYYECIVRGEKSGAVKVEVTCKADYGFYENSCDCGVVETQCVPCVHVMAVVKSKQVPYLTPTNVMPYCWSTAIWRKQFPTNGKICCNIDMEYLKTKYEPNEKLRFMPDFVGKRKRGRPKKQSRMKSALETALQKKKKKKGKGKGKKHRQFADDLLGPDDMEFSFGEGEKSTVDGEEGEV